MVHHNIIKRIRLLAAASLLLFASLTPVLFTTQDSYAAQITNRSLLLEQGSGGAEGGTPGPTEVVDHTFTFTMPTTSAGSEYQSVKFLYCDSADPLETNCTAPSGMTGTDGVDSVSTVSGLTGALVGATVDSSSANEVVLTFGSAQTLGSDTVSTVTFSDVNNPDQANYTFFVRIIAYSGTDGTGTVRHAGTVAASTAEPIVLTGVMPESLIFCAGATVEESSPGIPDCSTASTGAINFNDLFSPTATRFSFSQMAASTNAGSGYVISVNGPTLTSGGNTIPAMGTATTPVVGSGQFGLNLVENTAGGGLDLTTASFGVGQVNEDYDGTLDAVNEGFNNDNDDGTTPDIYARNVYTAPNGTNFRGQAATDYDTDGTFKFVSGDTVAESANGGAGPSDGQIYTVSYITNVAGSQAPGTYVTTLLYIATPTF